MRSTRRHTRSVLPLLLLLCTIVCTIAGGCSEESSGPDSDNSLPPADTIQSRLQFKNAAHARFTPDGTGIIVAHASDPFGRIVATLYDRATGQKIRTFEPYPSYIQEFRSMAISNDGTRLVVAGVYTSSIPSSHPGFMIWDIQTGEYIQRSLDLKTNKLPSALVFLPGDTIFVGAYEDRLIAYRTRPKLTPPTYISSVDSTSFGGSAIHSITQLEISPGGRYILANRPSLWDISSRTLIDDTPGESYWNASVLTYWRDEEHMIAGGDEGVLLVTVGKEVEDAYIGEDYEPDDFYAHDPVVLTVAASPDGNLIAAGDDRGLIKVWDANTGRPIVVGKAGLVPEFVLFSPDSKSIMSVRNPETAGDAHSVEIWDLPE